jgi:UPF0716 family protein affecting phage T7 exclusion
METVATFAAAVVVAAIMLAVGGVVAAVVGFFSAVGVIAIAAFVAETVDEKLASHYAGK